MKEGGREGGMEGGREGGGERGREGGDEGICVANLDSKCCFHAQHCV